jgi:hypothetical protein
MIWLQAGACFVLWVAYGFWLRRSSDRLKARMHGSSRRARTLMGSVGLLAGLVVLAVGLYLVYRFGGLTPDGLTGWGWAAVAGVGLVFVQLQVVGAAAMVSLVLEEVTARAPGPSVNQEKEDNE